MTKLYLSLILSVLFISGCAKTPVVGERDIEALATEIQKLGPAVDPAEAERAARIAYNYSLQLAQEYNVTDSPIIHNAKVTNGFRERGLCNHWTEDILQRLRHEDFETLSLHWATSPPTPFRIIHHTAVISSKGETLYDGIVLDPWRNSGALHWSATQTDERYNWRPRMEVREELLNEKRIRKASGAS